MAGNPISGARIDHTEHYSGRKVEHSSDTEGKFELWSNAVAVVIRKPGFESRRQFLKDTKEPESVRIILRPASEVAAAKPYTGTCSAEVIESHDVDYTSTFTGFKREDGTWLGVTCGRGLNWSHGEPNNSQVWNSEEYSEIMPGGNENGYVDARGKSKDGTYWRYRGVMGFSCSYSTWNKDAVPLLDHNMAGGCIRKPATLSEK